GDEGVTLRQRLAETLAQLRATGPAGGDEAVEMRAALRRRALDQREAIGREDRDGRAAAGQRCRVSGTAVEQVPAALRAADRSQEVALDAIVVADRRFGAGK